MTEHFCDDCNRLRLTADRRSSTPASATTTRSACATCCAAAAPTTTCVARHRRAVTGKRAGHEFQRTGVGAPRKHMIGIGG